MALKDIILAVPLSSFDSASIVAGYTALNAGGLTKPCSILRIINASNAAITISYDGSTDNDYVPANTTVQLNAQTNSQPNNQRATFSSSTVVYAKGTAGVGTIFVAGYYSPQGA